MTEDKFKKLLALRDTFFRRVFHIRLYGYQTRISDAILQLTLFQKSQKQRTLEIEIARQAGKTEALVCTIAFLLIFYRSIVGKRIEIIIFAPQREQAKTDFDRLKDRLEQARLAGFSELDPTESNAVTLQLRNKSYAYIFPLTPTSHPESKTGDLIIFEEANSIDDNEKKRKADPMGSATNAAEISIGVAGYRKNFFQRRIVAASNLIKVDANEVIEHKQKAYQETGDDWHLNYEAKFKEKVSEYGLDDDSIKTQYLLEWVLGTGQFLTEETYDALLRTLPEHKSDHRTVAGLDSAKSPDDTVLTIKCLDCAAILRWLELHGDNYQDQFDAIRSVLDTFPNMRAIAIDSTGQGDFLPDLFQRHTRWNAEETGLFRVKFSLQSKDAIYKNLLNVIRTKATAVPPDAPAKFKEQLLDLQKEYKGEFLSCHHPNQANAHDDYPDSLALCEWAAHKVAEIGEPRIITF